MENSRIKQGRTARASARPTYIRLFDDNYLVVAEGILLLGAVLANDLAELSLVFLHVVGQGIHELLCVFGAHDDAAYDRSLGHAGSGEDEVDDRYSAFHAPQSLHIQQSWKTAANNKHRLMHSG